MPQKKTVRAVLTTGQVARICQVSPRTVVKWIDSGRLKGYRIPGSQDRRVPRELLARFLEDNGMPLGDLGREARHEVLIVGAEPLLVERLRELLPESDGFRHEAARSGFEAGVLAHDLGPDAAVVIDHALGRSEAIQIARSLRRGEAHEETLIVALANEDEPDVEGLIEPAGDFSDAFKKPFDVVRWPRFLVQVA
jgi:excisionase family DNA binding protein